MATRINRRDFMATTAAAGLAAAARPLASGPTLMVQGSVRPVVVSSANGHRFKNGGTKTCVENAFEPISANPGERETDQYDSQSAHSLLVHRPTGTVVGTTRLILPKPESGSWRSPCPRIPPPNRGPSRC